MGTFRRLGLLAAAVGLTALVVAPAALANTPDCSSTFSASPSALLLNPNSGFSPNEATVALNTPIPAGDYELTMVSYDDHDAKAVDQSDQLNEQWFVILLDAQGNTVFQSGVSPDLPDDQNWLTFNSSATLTGKAVTMRVVHAAIGDNVNSIVAFCAGFEPISRTLGSIGDLVWLDTNGDGLIDAGEPGIEGIEVTLVGQSGSMTATTDAAGMYTFAELPLGAYDVTVGAGLVGTTLSTTGAYIVQLAEGENHVDADFGFTPVNSQLGSIGDTVWLDSNTNGVQDVGEDGIAGVTVTLSTPGSPGGQVATTGTDGTYLFSGLEAGTYDVAVDPASGPAGSDLTTPGSVSVALAAGENFADADFGLAVPQVLASAVIGDTAWMDSNLNQILDAGESPIAGVSVTLTNMGTGTKSTQVTNASGKYLFAALAAGAYEVTVNTSTAPEGTGLTTVGKYTITVIDGESSLIADFGFAPQLPMTGLETADFGIAGLVLLLIGALTLALVRPGKQTPWHLVNAYEVR